MLIDPQNAYEVSIKNSEAKLTNISSKEISSYLNGEHARVLLNGDKVVNGSKYSALVAPDGLLRSVSFRRGALARLIQAKLNGGTKGVEKAAFSIFGQEMIGTEGGKVKSTPENIKPQIILIDNLLDDAFSGRLDIDPNSKVEILKEVKTLESAMKQEPTDDTIKANALSAAETYKKLIDIFGPSSTDTLIGKVISDYGLKTDYKSLYANYNTFKQYMDMSDDLAKFVLMTANPINTVARTAIEQRWLQKASGFFRDKLGGPDQKQTTSISVSKALTKNYDEMGRQLDITKKVVQEKIDAIRNQSANIDTILKNADPKYAERRKQRAAEVSKAVRKDGTVDAEIKQLNDDLARLNQAIESWKAQREAYDKIREESGTRNYEYNGRTVSINKDNLKQIQARVDDYEKGLTPEELKAKKDNGRRLQDEKTLQYIAESNALNLHYLSRINVEAFANIAAGMSSMLVLLSQLQIPIEELRIKYLGSIQLYYELINDYVEMKASSIFEQQYNEVVDKIEDTKLKIKKLEAKITTNATKQQVKVSDQDKTTLKRYKALLNSYIDELLKLQKKPAYSKAMIKPALEQLEQDRTKRLAVAEEKYLKAIDGADQETIKKEKNKHKETLAKINKDFNERAKKIKVSTEIKRSYNFNQDKLIKKTEELKGPELFLKNLGINIIEKGKKGNLVDADYISKRPVTKEKLVLEYRIKQSAKDVINGALAYILGDTSAASFLKYKHTNDFVSKEVWIKSSEAQKTRYILKYIDEILTEDTDNYDASMALVKKSNFHEIFNRVDKAMSGDGYEYGPLQFLDEGKLQQIIMQQIFDSSSSKLKELKTILKTIMTSAEQFENNINKIIEGLDDNTVKALQSYIEKVNENLKHHTVYKYISNFFHKHHYLKAPRLSLFVRNTKIREHFFDNNKVNLAINSKSNFTVLGFLKEFGRTRDDLLHLVYDDLDIAKKAEHVRFNLEKKLNDPTLANEIETKSDDELLALVNTLKEEREDSSLNKENKIALDKDITTIEQYLESRDIRAKIKEQKEAYASAEEARKAQEELIQQDAEINQINALLDEATYDPFQGSTYFEFTKETIAALFFGSKTYPYKGVTYMLRPTKHLKGKKIISFYDAVNKQTSNTHRQAVDRFANELVNLINYRDGEIELKIPSQFKRNKKESTSDYYKRYIITTYLSGKPVEVTVNRKIKTVYGIDKNISTEYYRKDLFELIKKHTAYLAIQKGINAFKPDKSEKTNGDYYNEIKDTLTIDEQSQIVSAAVKELNENLGNDTKYANQMALRKISYSLAQTEIDIVNGTKPYILSPSEDLVKREIFSNKKMLVLMDDFINFNQGKELNSMSFKLLKLIEDVIVEEYDFKEEFQNTAYSRWIIKNGECYFVTKGEYPKEISLAELIIKYRIDETRLNDLIKYVFAHSDMKSINIHKRNEEVITIKDAFRSLYDELGKIVSFNTFDMNEEAFKALPANKDVSPEEISRRYKILTDRKLYHVTNLLKYSIKKDARFSTYYTDYTTNLYASLVGKFISNKKNGAITIHGKDFSEVEFELAFLYSVLKDDKLNADVKKKLVLDVFFSGYHMLRGYMDNESLQHAKDELAKAEKKLKNPKMSAAGVKTNTALKRKYLKKIETIEARQKEFNYQDLYEDIILKDPDRALKIVYNILGSKTKNMVTAYDPVTKKRYVTFKSVQNADGDYVPNVKDMSKGLPGKNAEIIENTFNEGIDKAEAEASKLRKDKVTAEIFKEQNIDVATLKASNDGNVVVVGNISDKEGLRGALEKHPDGLIKHVEILTQTQYDDIKEMVIDPTKYTDEEDMYFLDTKDGQTKMPEQYINVESKKTIIDVFFNDLKVINDFKKSGRKIAELKEYQDLLDSGVYVIPKTVNTGVSFRNTETYKALIKQAHLHKAYYIFLNLFKDTNLTQFNIEQISLRFFNNDFIKNKDIITEADIKAVVTKTAERQELTSLKINNEDLIKVLVRVLNEMHTIYKDSDINFNYKDILSKDFLNGMKSLADVTQTVAGLLSKHFRNIKYKIVDKYTKRENEFKLFFPSADELEETNKILSPFTLNDGLNILNEYNDQQLEQYIKDLSSNYSYDSVALKLKLEEIKKRYQKKREATLNKLKGVRSTFFNYSLLYNSFVKNIDDPSDISIEPIKDFIGNETYNLLVTKLGKETAEAFLKKTMDAYITNIYNAGYFHINDKTLTSKMYAYRNNWAAATFYSDLVSNKNNIITDVLNEIETSDVKYGVADGTIKSLTNLLGIDYKNKFAVLANNPKDPDYLKAIKIIYESVRILDSVNASNILLKYFNDSKQSFNKYIEDIKTKPVDESFKYYDPATSSGFYFEPPKYYSINETAMSVPANKEEVYSRRPDKSGRTIIEHFAQEAGIVDPELIKNLHELVLDKYEEAVFKTTIQHESLYRPQETSAEVITRINETDQDLQLYKGTDDYVASIKDPDEKQYAKIALEIRNKFRKQLQEPINMYFPDNGKTSAEHMERVKYHYDRMSLLIDYLSVTNKSSRELNMGFANTTEVVSLMSTHILNNDVDFYNYFKDIFTKKSTSGVEGMGVILNTKILNLLGIDESLSKAFEKSTTLNDFLNYYKTSNASTINAYRFMLIINRIKQQYIGTKTKGNLSYNEQVELFEKKPVEDIMQLFKDYKDTNTFGTRNFLDGNIKTSIENDTSFIDYALNKQKRLINKLGLYIPTEATSKYKEHTFAPQPFAAKDTTARILALSTQRNMIAPLFKDRTDVDIFDQEYIDVIKAQNDGILLMFAEMNAKDYKSIGIISETYSGIHAGFSELLFKLIKKTTPKDFVIIPEITSYITLINKDRNINAYFLNQYKSLVNDKILLSKDKTSEQINTELDKAINDIVLLFQSKPSLFQFDANTIKGFMGFLYLSKFTDTKFYKQQDELKAFIKHLNKAKHSHHETYINDSKSKLISLLDDPEYNNNPNGRAEAMFRLIYLKPYDSSKELDRKQLQDLITNISIYENSRDNTKIQNIFDTKDFMDNLADDSVTNAGSYQNYKKYIEWGAALRAKADVLNNSTKAIQNIVRTLKDHGTLPNSFTITYEYYEDLPDQTFKRVSNDSLKAIQQAIENQYDDTHAEYIKILEENDVVLEGVKSLQETIKDEKDEMVKKLHQNQFIRTLAKTLRDDDATKNITELTKKREALEQSYKKRLNKRTANEYWDTYITAYKERRKYLQNLAILKAVNRADDGKRKYKSVELINDHLVTPKERDVIEQYMKENNLTDATQITIGDLYDFYIKRLKDILSEEHVIGVKKFVLLNNKTYLEIEKNLKKIDDSLDANELIINNPELSERWLNEAIKVTQARLKTSKKQHEKELYNMFFSNIEDGVGFSLLREDQINSINAKIAAHNKRNKKQAEGTIKHLNANKNFKLPDDAKYSDVEQALNARIAKQSKAIGKFENLPPLPKYPDDSDKLEQALLQQIEFYTSKIQTLTGDIPEKLEDIKKKYQHLSQKDRITGYKNYISKRLADYISYFNYDVFKVDTTDDVSKYVSTFIKRTAYKAYANDNIYYSKVIKAYKAATSSNPFIVGTAQTDFINSLKDAFNKTYNETIDEDTLQFFAEWYSWKSNIKKREKEIYKQDEKHSERSSKLEALKSANKKYKDYKETLVSGYKIIAEDIYKEVDEGFRIREEFNELKKAKEVNLPYGRSNIGTYKKLYGIETNADAVARVLKDGNEIFDTEDGKSLKDYAKKYGDLDIHNPVIDSLLTYFSSNKIFDMMNKKIKSKIVLDIETLKDENNEDIPYQFTIIMPQANGKLLIATFYYNSYVFFDDADGKRGPLLERFFQQQKTLWNSNLEQAQKEAGEPIKPMSDEELELKFESLLHTLKGKPSTISQVQSVISILSNPDTTVITHNGRNYDKKVYEDFITNYTKRYLINMMTHEIRNLSPIKVLEDAGITDVDSPEAIEVLKKHYKEFIEKVKNGEYTSEEQMNYIKRHVDCVTEHILEKKVIQQMIQVENETGFLLNEEARKEILDPKTGIIAELRENVQDYLLTNNRDPIYNLFERGLDHTFNTPENIQKIRDAVDKFLDEVTTRYNKITKEGETFNYGLKISSSSVRGIVVSEAMDELNTTEYDFRPENYLKSYEEYIQSLKDVYEIDKKTPQNKVANLKKITEDQRELIKQQKELQTEVEDLEKQIKTFGEQKKFTIANINSVGEKLLKHSENLLAKVTRLLKTETTSENIFNDYVIDYKNIVNLMYLNTLPIIKQKLNELRDLLGRITDDSGDIKEELLSKDIFKDTLTSKYSIEYLNQHNIRLNELLKYITATDTAADDFKKVQDTLIEIIEKNLKPSIQAYLDENIPKAKKLLASAGIVAEISLDNFEEIRKQIAGLNKNTPEEEDIYKNLYYTFAKNGRLVESLTYLNKMSSPEFAQDIINDRSVRESISHAVKQSILVNKNTAELLKLKSSKADKREYNKEVLFGMFRTLATASKQLSDFSTWYGRLSTFNVLMGYAPAPTTRDELVELSQSAIKSTTKSTDEQELLKRYDTSRIYNDVYQGMDRSILVPSSEVIHLDATNENKLSFMFYDSEFGEVITVNVLKTEDGRFSYDIDGYYRYYTPDKYFVDKHPTKVKLHKDDLDKLLANNERSFYDKKDGIAPGLTRSNMMFTDNVDQSYLTIQKAYTFMKSLGRFSKFDDIQNMIKKNDGPMKINNIRNLGEQDSLVMQNLTERVFKKYVQQVGIADKIAKDTKTINDIAYRAVFEKSVKTILALPGNTVQVQTPEKGFFNKLVKLSPKQLKEFKLFALDTTEQLANVRYGRLSDYTYQPAFMANTNSMRTLLATQLMNQKYTSIKVINELYVDEDTSKEQKPLIDRLKDPSEYTYVTIDLLDKMSPSDRESALKQNNIIKRNNFLIREYQTENNESKRVDVFTPNILTEREWYNYQHDVRHKVGINMTVGYLNIPPAYEDNILMDAEVGRMLEWPNGQKTYLHNAGFKGSIILVEGLKAKTGCDVVAREKSVASRGTYNLYLEPAMNVIRKYLIGETTTDLNTGKKELQHITPEQQKMLDSHKEELKKLVKVRGDKLIVEPHLDYAYELNNIFKEGFDKLIIYDMPQKNTTFEFKTSKNTIQVETVTGNIKRGETYVVMDSAHRSEQAQSRSLTIRDGNLSLLIQNSKGTVLKGFLTSLTAMTPVRQRLGDDVYNKIFPHDSKYTEQYTITSEEGISTLVDNTPGMTDEEKLDNLNIYSDNLRAYAQRYLTARIKYTKNENKNMLKFTLFAINEASKKDAIKALAGGNKSIVYGEIAKRYPGVRQQVVTNVMNDLGTAILSKESMDELYENMNDDWLVYETVNDSKWSQITTFKSVYTNEVIKPDVDGKITFKSRLELQEYITHISRQGVINYGDRKIYTIDKSGLTISFQDKAIRYGYVLAVRSPVQNYGAVPIIKVVGFSDHYNVELSPYIYSMMGMDNDGDQIGMTAVKHELISSGELKSLDATNEDYYRNMGKEKDKKNKSPNYLLSVTEDLMYAKNSKTTVFDMRASYKGKSTFNSKIRKDNLRTFTEIFVNAFGDQFKKLFSSTAKLTDAERHIKKQIDDLAKTITTIDIDEMRKWTNVIIRLENGDSDYDGKAFTKVDDYLNDQKIKIFVSKNEEYIKKFMAFEMLYDKSRKISDFIILTRDIYNNNDLFVDKLPVSFETFMGIVNNPNDKLHEQALKIRDQLLFNTIYNRESEATVRRNNVSKITVALTGGARKRILLSSLLVTDNAINNDIDFFDKINATIQQQNLKGYEDVPLKPFDVSIESLGHALLGKKLFETLTNSTKEITDKDIVFLTSAKTSNPYLKKLLLDNINYHIIAQQEIPALIALFKRDNGARPTILETQTFLKNSSMKNDALVKGILALQTPNKSLSTRMSIQLLTLWFGENQNIIAKILNNRKIYKEEKSEILNGYIRQLLLTRKVFNDLDRLIQGPIDLAKHGGTNLDLDKYLDDNKKANTELKGRALRKIRVGTDPNYHINFSYAAEADVLNNINVWKRDATTLEGEADIPFTTFDTYDSYKKGLKLMSENIMNYALFGRVPLAYSGNERKAVNLLLKQLNSALRGKNPNEIKQIFKTLASYGINFRQLQRGYARIKATLYLLNNALKVSHPNKEELHTQDVSWLKEKETLMVFLDQMQVKELKERFIKDIRDDFVASFIKGQYEDDDYIYINDAEENIEVSRSTGQDMLNNAMLDDVTLNEVNKLDNIKAEFVFDTLNKHNTVEPDAYISVENYIKDIINMVGSLFKNIEQTKDIKIEEVEDGDKKQKALTSLVLREGFDFDAINKMSENISNDNNVKERLEQDLENSKSKLGKLLIQMSINETLLRKLKRKKDFISTGAGNKKEILKALQESIADAETKFKEQKTSLLTAVIYEHVGNLIKLLKTKDGLGITDVVNDLQPKTITAKTVDQLQTTNIMNMDKWQVPFLNMVEFARIGDFNDPKNRPKDPKNKSAFDYEMMYDWYIHSNYVLTKSMYAFDDETLANRLLSVIRRTDKSFNTKGKMYKLMHRPNTRFETLDDLKDFLKDLAEGNTKDVLIFNKREYKDIEAMVVCLHKDIPSLFDTDKQIKVKALTDITNKQTDELYIVDNKYYTWNGDHFIEQFGIDQFITPTLKEIRINGPKDLQKIHEHLIDAAVNGKEDEQFKIGFTNKNDMLSAMEQGYRGWETKGKFAPLMGTLLYAQKLLMRLSFGFLFRNAADTFNQFISQLIEEQGVGVLTNKEVIRYLGMTFKVYNMYKYVSEERMQTLAEIKTNYEDLQALVLRGSKDTAAIQNKIEAIKDRLESYVILTKNLNETETTSTMKRNIPKAEALLTRVQQVINQIKKNPQMIKQALMPMKQVITFLGNISFAEYFLLYDNQTINGKDVAGLRVDAYELGAVQKDGKRYKEIKKLTKLLDQVKREEEYYEDFKTALFEISAFMNTNAQIDVYKQEQYKDLRKVIELHNELTKNPEVEKTYEQISEEIEKARNDASTFLGGFLKNAYQKAYEQVNEDIENVARIGAYLFDRRINGYTHTDTVQRSLNRWFNYGQRDPMEMRLIMDIPYLSFPIRSIQNWIGRLLDPSYMRFMSDVIDGMYSQYADDDGQYDEFTQYQINNGWLPITKKWGIRFGNGAFDVQNILNDTTSVISQRTNPLLRGIQTLLETKDLAQSLKALAITGVITRVLNGVSGLSGTRSIIQRTPIINNLVSDKPSSPGTTVSFLYDINSDYKKYTPYKYRYPNNGRYAKYENIYRDWFNKYGRMRKPKVDPMSIVKDIQWRQYVRWRQSNRK